MKDTIEKCVDCGEKYIKKHVSQIRCKECQRKHDIEKQAEKNEAKRKRTYAPHIKDPNVCKKTKTCKYGGKTGGIRICDYLEITGTRRGCPVQNCEKYTSTIPVAAAQRKVFLGLIPLASIGAMITIPSGIF